MNPRVIRAEALRNCVAITYVNRQDYSRSVFENEHTDFLYTEPIGGWNVLRFDGDDCDYISFLETMVFKNIEVYRKIAVLITRRLLQKKRSRVKVLEAMSVLDPTFVPPEINTNCRWQMEMLDGMIPHVYTIISTSYSSTKLKWYISTLKSSSQQ